MLLSLQKYSLMIAAVLLLCSNSTAEDLLAINELEKQDKVRVRLVSAQRSIKRGQNLVAQFETVREKEPRKIIVEFPAHSFTPHERTLFTIINACCPYKDEHAINDPRPSEFEAEFTIPDESQWIKQGTAECLAKCLLVRLKLD